VLYFAAVESDYEESVNLSSSSIAETVGLNNSERASSPPPALRPRQFPGKAATELTADRPDLPRPSPSTSASTPIRKDKRPLPALPNPESHAESRSRPACQPRRVQESALNDRAVCKKIKPPQQSADHNDEHDNVAASFPRTVTQQSNSTESTAEYPHNIKPRTKINIVAEPPPKHASATTPAAASLTHTRRGVVPLPAVQQKPAVPTPPRKPSQRSGNVAGKSISLVGGTAVCNY